MDAKRLGTFIAERRKELGLTQACLARQLSVTDKAVSRWERGIGLPDISNIELLATALDVSLVELLQARKNNEDRLSAEEAENLLMDTIQLSKAPNKFIKIVGTMILAFFAMIVIMLLCMLVFDGNIILYSVASIVTGLIAWAIPIWRIAISHTSRTILYTITSLGFALLSVWIQFLDIASEVHAGDLAAIMDTIDVLAIVVFVFIAVTFVLNLLMAKTSDCA